MAKITNGFSFDESEDDEEVDLKAKPEQLSRAPRTALPMTKKLVGEVVDLASAELKEIFADRAHS
jgi:hypothetical protein